MRILYDSKQPQFKTPFGTLTPGQTCSLHIHVPASVQATSVTCELLFENNSPARTIVLEKQSAKDAYEIFGGDFALDVPALYFYFFRVHTPQGSFRLFKQGDDTNMEAGALWQLSCVPETFHTPDWAKGAVIYQVFPDRFCRAGDCDLTGKLTPYTVHESWDEEVCWQPNEKGEVLNNDFYGGNFRGITEKLDYIASLGVTILYLNPISKSFSSHRYDTGDYKIPDPMLGTEEDFKALCDAAHARGIRVILDGVYSHTGADSLYFDKLGRFGGKGAFCTKDSPYYSWYTFKEYPHTYNSWWGFDTLPTVRKTDPAFMEFIFEAEDSVLAHWLSLGADGFRLDVADELPNEFMSKLKKRLRQLRPDALLMGEVWEDASNKIAYNIRRRYFVDATLDSVMNYPFQKAILDFLRGTDDGTAFRNRVLSVVENYPAQVLSCNMNLLGTHDTPRILTALVDDFDGSREQLAVRKLDQRRLELARQRLFAATVLQFTLPGSPSIYYGDEAGMEGGKDPFNRRPYPWGREDTEILEHYRTLGQLRRGYEALRKGKLSFFASGGGRLGYTRSTETESLRIYVNQSDAPWQLPGGKCLMGTLLSEGVLPPGGYCIMED